MIKRVVSKIKIKRPGKKFVVGLVFFLVLGILVSAVVKARSASTNAQVASNPLIAQAAINQEFKLEALLPNKKMDNVKMRLTSAEKRTEILVQGKPAQTKNDKIFLVLNLEIDNADSLPKYMSPVDVFRLVDANGKQFAADVHSGMLEIQPLSTKLNKIAFVIDKNQNQFNLKVGDLDGEKHDLQINFN